MQELKVKRVPVTRLRFREIYQSIKSDRSATNAAIARKHSVSEETVRLIRQAGTWPQFGRDKQTRRERKAGVPITDVRPSASVSQPDVKVVTVEEYRSIIVRLSGLERWRGDIETKEDLLNALYPRRRGIFSFLSWRGR